MSEKQQHTAARMREQMKIATAMVYITNTINYTFLTGNIVDHTHLKQNNGKIIEQERDINCSTGLLHEMKLRKIRKRLDKGRFH